MFVPQVDVVVVGTGISGLLAALRASNSGASTLIVSDGGGASSWLQGVNVAVGHADGRDSPAVHCEDIIREGYGLSSRRLAADTAIHAVEVFEELDALGVDFARDGTRFRQRHASGSTYARCAFVAGMMWGPKARRVLTKALKQRANVEFLTAHVVRVLLSEGHAVGIAAVLPRTGEPVAVDAGAVVLACGGVGGLFAHSTYPRDVAGSSYALAFRAGARLVDLEFIQFEPLVAYEPRSIRGFVIPTTLFGDGATLRDKHGTRFLLEVRPQGEAGIGKETLVLAMAEMAMRGRSEPTGAVWLDARSVDREVLAGYPWLYPYLLKRGIDLSRDMVALLPAAHTSLGGILIDDRRESSVRGLFAVGEAAGGIHGAGRLAGGSGTDVIASGSRGGDSAAKTAELQRGRKPAAAEVFRSLFSPGAEAGRPTKREREIMAEASSLMSAAAGIWRNEDDLSRALVRVRELREAVEPLALVPAGRYALRLADSLLVDELILMSAIDRRESRGAHQRTDFPKLDTQAAASIIEAAGSNAPSVASMTKSPPID